MIILGCVLSITFLCDLFFMYTWVALTYRKALRIAVLQKFNNEYSDLFILQYFGFHLVILLVSILICVIFGSDFEFLENGMSPKIKIFQNTTGPPKCDLVDQNATRSTKM